MANLARSGQTNPLGKLTAEIPKLKVAEETREELDRKARQAGLTLTEYARLVLEINAHGFDTIAKLQADRLRVVAGKGGI